MGYGNTEVFLTARQREELIQNILGKQADIIIDRPVGYVHHTKGITLCYPINYGYIPGLMGGDGEEQDVYILGVQEPLDHFTGRIIGVIRRHDDNEDKLVAAPEGMHFTREQIADAVRFTEQYFSNTIEVLQEEVCLSLQCP